MPGFEDESYSLNFTMSSSVSSSDDAADDWAQFADPSKQQLVLLRAPSGSSGAAWRPLAASDCGRERARTLACQLHDAVAYLHDKCDIVHGAIGVDMCVVASDGAPSLRLLLRASAAAAGAGGDELARLVRLAPECAAKADAPVASKAADVYAYGVVLFYLCAGHLPFQRRSRTALLHAITKMSASDAMPLGDELELHAEIRAATRHKPSKRTLARPAEPLAASSSGGKKSDTFRARAANRQSRAVVVVSPRKLTASEQRRRHAAAPIAALADATDGERAAFEALCGGAAAGALLAAIVAERAQEGLFRVPGDASDADAYRRDSAKVLARLLAAPQRHAHTLASLFKQLLREHSSALLPAAVDRDARDLLQLAENADGNDDDDDELVVVDQLRLLLAAATAQQRLALRHLARAFHALVAAEPQNKMSLPALVTCVGPSLAISPGWIKWSVMRFDKLFTLKTS
jgi:hypothetical protein